MNTWIFQANDKYILQKEVPERSEDWWYFKQHWNKVGIGDVCLFWQSGDKAGIHAVGLVKSSVYGVMDERKIDVWYDGLVDPPLLKSQLLDHPILKDLDILDRPRSRNPYNVTPQQSRELHKLLGEHWPLTAAETAERAKPFASLQLHRYFSTGKAMPFA